MTIAEEASSSGTAPANPEHGGRLELDALVVGGGFSGCYMLHKLRDELNLNAKLFEAGTALGGTWHRNRYPGARVDLAVPGYEYSMEQIWDDWKWTEKYPGQPELQAYFDHVDKTLSLSKDCYFSTEVCDARFDTESATWTVRTKDGKCARAKYLIVAVGFAAKQHVPDWKGLDTFAGDIYYSADWPTEHVDVRGKRVAVIGTGSTGIQIIQEWARDAAETTVFQRTPNTALPMCQSLLPPGLQEDRASRLQIFEDNKTTNSGLELSPIPQNTMDVSPEERLATYERLYGGGGLWFWNINYQDLTIDPVANREAYDFWAKKTRARINDPRARDLLAPLEPLHPWGVKRPSLEQNYYELFNKPNVRLVSTRESPIVEIRPNGIVTEDGQLYEVDMIAVATGFDTVTGGIKNVGIKDKYGFDVADQWNKQGVRTHLGMMVGGCPNLFMPYSAQSPSVFTNGPTSIEFQVRWIADVIRKMRELGVRAVDVSKESEQAWRKEVTEIANMTLLPKAKSWYMGANIPGKPVEPLFYLGGMLLYRERCLETSRGNLDGLVKM